MTACIDCHDTLLPHPQRPVSPHDQSDTRTVHKLRILKIKNNPFDIGSAHDPVRLLSDPVRLRDGQDPAEDVPSGCVFEFKQLHSFSFPLQFFYCSVQASSIYKYKKGDVHHTHPLLRGSSYSVLSLHCLQLSLLFTIILS